jgi:hypothetical protein
MRAGISEEGTFLSPEFTTCWPGIGTKWGQWGHQLPIRAIGTKKGQKERRGENDAEILSTIRHRVCSRKEAPRGHSKTPKKWERCSPIRHPSANPEMGHKWLKWLILPTTLHKRLGNPSSGHRSRGPSRHQVGTKSEPSRDQVNPPVAVVVLIRLIGSSGPLGNSEILSNLGHRDRTHLRERYIDPALADGLVGRTIPEKPTSRLQKYRLTEKGRRLL